MATAAGSGRGAERRAGTRASTASSCAIHRLAVTTAASTILLITAGGLVTSTGSGLSVPDWPLSYGTLFPPMVGGVLYEHGHRMIAAVVGLLTAVLAVWVWRRETRPVVRRLAWVALATVVTQAVLGGITVLFLLPTAVSVAHACLAQGFLLMVTSLAVMTAPGYPRAPIGDLPLARLGVATTAAVYLQLILGALTRHTGSGLAIPDFPLALGRIVPPFDSPQVAIQFAHRIGALGVTGLILATAWTALPSRGRASRGSASGGPASAGRGAALLLVPLCGLQIALGAFSVWTHLHVAPATAHVTVGALLLATSLVVALRARHGSDAGAGAGAGAGAKRTASVPATGLAAPAVAS